MSIVKKSRREKLTSVVATTKGLAAAPVFDFVATKRESLVLGTIKPMTKTPPM